MNVSDLIDKALEARKNAYAPYSGYTVGAALLTDNEEIFTGCNIENSALAPSVCAERTAFFTAVAAGAKKFTAIAVAGGTAGDSTDAGFAFPCGVCRQVMLEFCDRDFEIVVAKSRDDYSVYALKELLPHGFGPEDLKKQK